MFKGMMDKKAAQKASSDLEQRMKDAFLPQKDVEMSYQFEIEEKPQPLHVIVRNEEMDCHYGPKSTADVTCRLNLQSMNDIVYGRMTFQRAFMTGVMTSKGEFKNLRLLDQMFSFR